jgi:hypothetical protein
VAPILIFHQKNVLFTCSEKRRESTCLHRFPLETFFSRNTDLSTCHPEVYGNNLSSFFWNACQFRPLITQGRAPPTVCGVVPLTSYQRRLPPFLVAALQPAGVSPSVPAVALHRTPTFYCSIEIPIRGRPLYPCCISQFATCQNN